MNKPLSLLREDYIQALVQATNECDLPPFVALEVLRSVTAEVESLAKRQYEADRKAWEESQAEESGKEVDDA